MNLSDKLFLLAFSATVTVLVQMIYGRYRKQSARIKRAEEIAEAINQGTVKIRRSEFFDEEAGIALLEGRGIPIPGRTIRLPGYDPVSSPPKIVWLEEAQE